MVPVYTRYDQIVLSPKLMLAHQQKTPNFLEETRGQKCDALSVYLGSDDYEYILV